MSTEKSKRSSAALRPMFAAAFLLAAAAAVPAADWLEVAVEPSKAPVKLFLHPDTPALVEAAVPVHLQAGLNRLRFDWARERIDGNSVRLRIATAGGEDVEILAVTRPLDSPKTVYYDLKSPVEGEGLASVAYLLGGVGWKVDYLGFLNQAEDRIDLAMTLEVTNQSGMDLSSAEAALDVGTLASLDIEHGASCRCEMLRAEGVPVEKCYEYDAARPGGKVAVLLKLTNDPAWLPGGTALPSGKIRLFKAPSADAPAALVGEDVFPSTARGEEARITMGNATDVTVERKVLKSARENERRDRWNKVVVFDQRDRLRIEATSHKDVPITLKIVEHLSETWEITEKGRDYERKDADTIEYSIPLAEKGKKEILEIEYVRRDLW